jgi:hypothetical protein
MTDDQVLELAGTRRASTFMNASRTTPAKKRGAGIRATTTGGRASWSAVSRSHGWPIGFDALERSSSQKPRPSVVRPFRCVGEVALGSAVSEY